MGALTPANSARPRFCEGCGGLQYVHMHMVPASTRHMRFLAWRTIKLRGTTVRAWLCPACGRADDAGTRFPPPADPVRPEIVNAIRRLKAAGHRFFEWEKVSERPAP